MHQGSKNELVTHYSPVTLRPHVFDFVKQQKSGAPRDCQPLRRPTKVIQGLMYSLSETDQGAVLFICDFAVSAYKACLIRLFWINHCIINQLLLFDMTYNKYEREGLCRRIHTLIKKGYEVGEFDNVEVAIIVLNHGRFSTYRSTDEDSWPPSIADIVCFHIDSPPNSI